MPLEEHGALPLCRTRAVESRRHAHARTASPAFPAQVEKSTNPRAHTTHVSPSHATLILLDGSLTFFALWISGCLSSTQRLVHALRTLSTLLLLLKTMFFRQPSFSSPPTAPSCASAASDNHLSLHRRRRLRASAATSTKFYILEKL